MSLVPAFQIGLWNAWIFELYSLLPCPIFILTPLKKRGPANPETLPLEQKEKRIFGFSRVVMFLPFIYSIFLPLQLGTTWFYVGLPIALMGLILYTIVWVNLATTPTANGPATGGLYRYSRHPMYLTGFLMAIGISIACASWLFLLLSIISFFFANVRYAGMEERSLLEEYGNVYREYMDRTPKWIGMPKSGNK